jgi:hypothetical protein
VGVTNRIKILEATLGIDFGISDWRNSENNWSAEN